MKIFICYYDCETYQVQLDQRIEIPPVKSLLYVDKYNRPEYW